MTWQPALNKKSYTQIQNFLLGTSNYSVYSLYTSNLINRMSLILFNHVDRITFTDSVIEINRE